MAQMPANINSHLDAVVSNEEGGLLLSSSSLTNRSWVGGLWYYDNPDLAPDVEKYTAGVEVESGVSDLVWITGTETIVGACDSGAVMLWKLTENRQTFQGVAQMLEHDGIVDSVSNNADNTKVVSGSHDHRIKVWDLKECTSVGTYKAHHNIVNCVSCHPTNSSILVSASQDGRLLLWDFRQAKPVSIIETQFLPSLPTCVAWQPNEEHGIVVGTETGALVTQDTRFSVGQPSVISAHSRPVTRLKYAPHKPHWVASASEDCRVLVTDTESATVVSCDNSHTDFVRGVTWDPKTSRLFSCGWDQRVIGRSVSEIEGLACPLATMEIDGGSIKSPETKMESDDIKPQCNGYVEDAGAVNVQKQTLIDTKG